MVERAGLARKVTEVISAAARRESSQYGDNAGALFQYQPQKNRGEAFGQHPLEKHPADHNRIDP
jgi:hypothetical protein